MSPKPPPRPALRKAPDSQRHPAAPPRLVVVRSDVSDAAATAAANARKKGGKGKDEPDTELVVKMPKALRKRLRAKAEEHGLSAEEATYELIRVWVDG